MEIVTSVLQLENHLPNPLFEHSSLIGKIFSITFKDVMGKI